MRITARQIAISNAFRQREIPLDDFALRGESIAISHTIQPKPLRAVDLPGPQPPADLTPPIQETLL